MNYLESQPKKIGIMPFEIPTEMKLNEHVQLKNISVIYENGEINIHWEAETKGQDYIFIIERSDDGKLFEIIGINRGCEINKTKTLSCHHKDEKPQMNFPYYRIIYVEKSKVIFGKICRVENFESMMLDRVKNSAVITNRQNHYIQ